VSRKKQEDGGSPEEQTEINNSYAKREKLNVLKKYQFAETASDHSKRKQWDAMMDDIRRSQTSAKPIKHVIFAFQSRSNRNRYSARELEDLVEIGVTLHFAREGRKLTCRADVGQWMVWHVENMRNASYIDELRKNAMSGIMKSIEHGVFPGKPKFGYKVIGKKRERGFDFDGDKADYMRRAFQLVLKHEARIALREFSDEQLKALLDQEYPQIKKTPDKKRFCELLRSPFYYGDFLFDGAIYRGDPDHHPALISKANWLKVQDILEGRHRKRRLSKAHPYIGLVSCNGKILDDVSNVTDERCGCSITAETIRKSYKSGGTQEFHYYRCSNTERRCSQRDKEYMRAVVGRNVSYRDHEVEEIFQDIFRSFSFDELTYHRMTKYLWEEHFEAKKQDHANRDRLQARQRELASFIDQSYEDKLTGRITEELWSKNNQKWHAEKQKVTAELASLEDAKDEYMQRGVTLIELMQHSEMVYKKATPEIKRRMVELVSSNLLLGDGTLQYSWRIPFNMLAIKGNLDIWLGC